MAGTIGTPKGSFWIAPDGSGSSIGAEVEWGPQFGGTDGDEFNVGVSAVVNALALDHQKTVASQLVMDRLALDHIKIVGCQLVMNTLALDHTKSVGVDVTELQYATSAILAGKDSWCETVALCPVDVTHDATDLEVSGTVAATRDAYMAWDLSGFPASSTVTAATFRLHLKTAALVSQDINIFKITNANEGAWTEAGLKCSNRPAADGAAMQSFATGTTSDVEIVIALNATVLTRIDDRMGAGFVTFLLQNQVASVLTSVFESADEGTDNAEGPRLEITFTVPV